MSGAPGGLALELRCTLDAPRERIFKALTDPAELVKWWGPSGFTTPGSRWTWCIGGGYRFGMQPPDGALFHLAGEFLEIEPPAGSPTPSAGRSPTRTTGRRSSGCPWRRQQLTPRSCRWSQGTFATEARWALHRGRLDGFLRETVRTLRSEYLTTGTGWGAAENFDALGSPPKAAGPQPYPCPELGARSLRAYRTYASDSWRCRGRRVVPTARDLRVWTRVGAAGGFLAVLSYTLISAAPLSSTQGLVVACVFGPALMCASTGLYHVLRAHRRTVTLDLGLMANVAAGVTVTVMLFAQLGLKRWFEVQFGTGSTDSSERALHAAFEAANGIQLGRTLRGTCSLPRHRPPGPQHVGATHASDAYSRSQVV